MKQYYFKSSDLAFIKMINFEKLEVLVYSSALGGWKKCFLESTVENVLEYLQGARFINQKDYENIHRHLKHEIDPIRIAGQLEE